MKLNGLALNIGLQNLLNENFWLDKYLGLPRQFKSIYLED